MYNLAPSEKLGLHAMEISGGSDDDFDSFKPLKKKCKPANVNAKLVGKQAKNHSPKSKVKNNTLKQEKKKTVPSSNTNRRSSEKAGYCPMCQLPFLVLTIESPEWHVAECMQTAAKVKLECPSGLQCNNTIASHYQKYSHDLLAAARAQGPSTQDTVTNTAAISREHQTRSGDTQEEKHSASVIVIAPSTYCDINSDTLTNCDTEIALVSADLTFLETNKLLETFEKDNHAKVSKGNDSDSDIFASDNSLGDTEEINDTLTATCNRNTYIGETKKKTIDNNDSDGLDNSDHEITNNSQGAANRVLIESDELETAKSECSEGEIHSEVGEEQCNESDSDNENVAEVSDTELLQFEENEVLSEDLFASNNLFQRSTNSQMSQNASQHTGSSVSVKKQQSSIFSFFQSRSGQGATGNSKPNACVNGNSKALSPKRKKLQNDQFMKRFNSSTVKKSKLIMQKSVSHNNSIPVDNSTSSKSYNQSRSDYRSCPFYKKIPGTPFTVDAFCYGSVAGCSAYFLSHFHYDHYRGLGKRFCHPIYCSKVTGNLVKKKLYVDVKYIHTIEMNMPTSIDDVEVTLLDANHCPGSVLFLFRLPDGRNVLHTGDFRADTKMELYPELQGLHISELYLDTTYCNPTYTFPSQQDVIRAATEVLREHLHSHPNALVVVGTYTIGKERIFVALAEECNSQIFVTKEKQKILECQENPAINKRLTTVGQGARVHVLPMGQLNYNSLSEHLQHFKGQYDSVVAFEPTGWTHSRSSSSILNLKPKLCRNNITIYGVPYSEHSSYSEMRRFVQWCHPQRIIPTVNNGSPQSRAKMEAHFKSWFTGKRSSPVKQTNITSFMKQ